MRNVLLAAFTPPIGIRLMMTDEFLGIRAPSSVYSEEKKHHTIINKKA